MENTEATIQKQYLFKISRPKDKCDTAFRNCPFFERPLPIVYQNLDLHGSSYYGSWIVPLDSFTRERRRIFSFSPSCNIASRLGSLLLPLVCFRRISKSAQVFFCLLIVRLSPAKRKSSGGFRRSLQDGYISVFSSSHIQKCSSYVAEKFSVVSARIVRAVCGRILPRSDGVFDYIKLFTHNFLQCHLIGLYKYRTEATAAL